MSTVTTMENTLSLCGMPTEVLVKILGSLPDLQTVGSSSLTCRRIHDVCAENTKAITDALISSIECSKLAVQYYEVRLQYARWRVASHTVNPPRRFPLQPSFIQRARVIQAIAKVGHCAQSMYLTQMTQLIAIDREFWQSIYYKALILSSAIQRQSLEKELGFFEIKVQLSRDLDILTLSQISDVYAALGRLSNQQIETIGWLEYDELRFHEWESSWHVIYCIRSYLCVEHPWYRDWTCDIGEGNFMARREPCGKLVKDLVDEGECVIDIRRDGYSRLLKVSIFS